MLSLVKAIAYFICHPFDVVTLTIVRRYVDAQGHYIGELYEGDKHEAKMIGVSCDNWPLNVGETGLIGAYTLCYSLSFLDPMPANTIRVGSLEPTDNATIRAYISKKRFCHKTIIVRNRFIEYVLQGNVKI